MSIFNQFRDRILTPSGAARIDAGGGDPDAHLARTRGRCVHVADNQHVRAGPCLSYQAAFIGFACRLKAGAAIERPYLPGVCR